MKYYSELTGELFDTVDELKETEEKIHRERIEAEKANDEINKAFDAAVEAWNHYLDVSKKYGRESAVIPSSLFKDVVYKFFT